MMRSNGEITEAQVLEFLKTFEDASNTEQFANVAGMIHPDALFRFNDGDHRGIEAIKLAFEGTWAHEVEDERYFLTDIRVEHLDVNSASTTFQFTWSGIGPEGEFQIVGRGSNVIVRHEGKLKIALEHLSR